MYYNDNFDPAAENDFEKLQNDNDFEHMLENTKKIDRGYNQITKKYINYDGKSKSKKIDIYTSSGYGSFIRDAESGTYYNYKVGSSYEDLFFKVSFANGKLNSTNESNTLFYLTPQHYMKHMMCEVPQEIINNWENKKNLRLTQINNKQKTRSDTVVVK